MRIIIFILIAFWAGAVWGWAKRAEFCVKNHIDKDSKPYDWRG